MYLFDKLDTYTFEKGGLSITWNTQSKLNNFCRLVHMLMLLTASEKSYSHYKCLMNLLFLIHYYCNIYYKIIIRLRVIINEQINMK